LSAFGDGSIPIRARASGSHGLPAALRPVVLENIGRNIGSSGGNTAIQLGKTAMNADTSDAVLTLVININGDDAPRTTAATLAGS
jgi:hypothetical protein